MSSTKTELPFIKEVFRGRSSVGRAPQWHCGGRRFEPDRLHHFACKVKNKFRYKFTITFHLISSGFVASCGENELRNEAIELFENNNSQTSGHDQNSSAILRSTDGLQFIKENSLKKQAETVGLTKDGKLSFEGKLKDGKPHGDWITFFGDGRPRWKGTKKEGLSHGPFTMWYPNGKKKIEGIYEDGQKHGLSTIWHLNGAKWKEQSHNYGEPSGIWRTWNENGVLTESIDQNASRKN